MIVERRSRGSTATKVLVVDPLILGHPSPERHIIGKRFVVLRGLATRHPGHFLPSDLCLVGHSEEGVANFYRNRVSLPVERFNIACSAQAPANGSGAGYGDLQVVAPLMPLEYQATGRMRYDAGHRCLVSQERRQ